MSRFERWKPLLSGWKSRRRSRLRTEAAAVGQVKTGFAQFETLETRALLSAAHNVIGLTALRQDAAYSTIDGRLDNGERIGVAIIDTGTYAQHRDLSGNFLAYFDAVATDAAGDSGVTLGTTDIAAARDPGGHGTHVAGTAVSTNPEIGAATNAGLIAIRALTADGEARPSHDTVYSALVWVKENRERYNIRVVNMSLGTYGYQVNEPVTNDSSRLIDELESLGVTVVAASGNDYVYHTALAGRAAPGASLPGAYSTLSVANTWEDSGVGDTMPDGRGIFNNPGWGSFENNVRADLLSTTSQRSTLPNQVAAPGSIIYSTYNDGGYQSMLGTSMASPLVAGVVALIQDAAMTFGGRYLTPAEVADLVRSTADEIVDSNNPNNFYGRVTGWNGSDPVVDQQRAIQETGLTFLRVNVNRAVRTVHQRFAANPSDLNNTISEAIELPSLNATEDFTFTGRIGSDGRRAVGASDVDLYKLVLDTPGQILFDVDPVSGGTRFDAIISLFNSSGTLMNQVDDAEGDLYPRLLTGRLLAGTYYVGISSYPNSTYNITNGGGVRNGNSMGDYSVTATLFNPDPNGVVQGAFRVELTSPNSSATARMAERGIDSGGRFYSAMPVASKFSSAIGSDPNPLYDPTDPTRYPERIEVGDTDVDFFRVVAPDNGTLVIDIESQDIYGSDAVDSYVKVYELLPNGQLAFVGFNDDSAGSYDSFLEVDVQLGRTYLVGVTTYGNRDFNPLNPYGRVSTRSDVGFMDVYLGFANGDVNGSAYGAVDYLTFDTDGDGKIRGIIGSDFGVPLAGAGGGNKDVDFVYYTPTQSGLLEVNVTSPDNTLNPAVGAWVLGTDDITQIFDTTGRASSFIAEVQAGITYLLSVTGLGNSGFNWFSTASGSGGDTGTYEISAQLRSLSDLRALRNDSVNNGTPTVIRADEVLNGEIGVDGVTITGADDVDLYRFIAPRDMRIEVRTYNSEEDDADTYLRVFDGIGREIIYNDDIDLRNTASRVTLNVRQGQIYYFGVNGYSSGARNYNALTGVGAAEGSTGGYRIAVTDLSRPIVVTGTKAGTIALTNMLDGRTGRVLHSFLPFGIGFIRGVNVATGDITGDGVNDIVVSVASNGPSHVRVIDGYTFQQVPGIIGSFFAYGAAYRGGVELAVGDVNGDGFADIITSPLPGVGPHVKVFSGRDGSTIHSFFAFAGTFKGGVRVAAGDVTGDGRSDIIVGIASGGPSHIKVFNGPNRVQVPGAIGSFYAYNPAYWGGVTVAAGDVNRDGRADITIGPIPPAGMAVRVYSGANRALLRAFFPYGTAYRGGINVASADLDGDGFAEVMTGVYSNAPPHVMTFDGRTGLRWTNGYGSFFAYSSAFRGGVTIAAAGAAPVRTTALGAVFGESPATGSAPAIAASILNAAFTGSLNDQLLTGVGSALAG